MTIHVHNYYIRIYVLFSGIGSDIGGSIRMPAFFNGVFGHKPSPLTVSNHGQYPEPVTDEQNKFLGLGPICRRAEDLLPIMKVIANKHRERLRLDEDVDVKKLRWFYQETDTGSAFVSPVSGEIKELFTKIAKHLDKAHGVKATKVIIGYSFCLFGETFDGSLQSHEFEGNSEKHHNIDKVSQNK